MIFVLTISTTTLISSFEYTFVWTRNSSSLILRKDWCISMNFSTIYVWVCIYVWNLYICAFQKFYHNINRLQLVQPCFLKFEMQLFQHLQIFESKMNLHLMLPYCHVHKRAHIYLFFHCLHKRHLFIWNQRKLFTGFFRTTYLHILPNILLFQHYSYQFLRLLEIKLLLELWFSEKQICRLKSIFFSYLNSCSRKIITNLHFQL